MGSSFFQSSGVGKKLAIIPIIFIVAVIGIIAYTTITLDGQKSDARVISVAGRQRMLNQRHMKEVLLGKSEQYQATRALLKTSVEVLIKGGDPKDGNKGVIPEAPTPEIRKLFEEQSKKLKQIIVLTDELVTLEAGSEAYTQKLTKTLEEVGAYHKLAYGAVAELSELSADKVTSMIWIEIIIGIVAILVGVVVSWFVSGSVTRPLDKSINTLTVSTAKLSNLSDQLRGTADNSSGQAQSVSAASEEVAANMQTVSASSSEMTATIQEIAKNASQASEVATEAVRQAETANQTIAKLGDSSDEIGEVIKTITSIAEQTNLLALNATIEAARAGEAGKGFAVVANEVKELAKQTAGATEEIRQKIETIQSDTGEAVEAIKVIDQVINQVNEISSTIAGAVEEQASTTKEINRNVTQASEGAQAITESITGVVTASNEASEGASQLMESTEELTKVADQLRIVLSGK